MFRVLVPPPGVMDAFRRLADRLIAFTVENAGQSRTLAELRDLLLPRLISGEIRVGEAEGVVEAANP